MEYIIGKMCPICDENPIYVLNGIMRRWCISCMDKFDQKISKRNQPERLSEETSKEDATV